MNYDLNFKKEEGEIQTHIKKFFLFPQYWKKLNNQLPIKLNWNSMKFSALNKGKIPSKKGIYAFVLIPEYNNFIKTKYLFYVGKTNRTLKKRFSEYLTEKDGKRKPRIKVFKMLNQFDGYLYFFYSEIPNKSDVDKCEEVLLNTFVPHINVSIPEAKIKPHLKYIYEGS
ncbi:MAG: GIY-YIG nuclease family protein [Polaribacter sp.]